MSRLKSIILLLVALYCNHMLLQSYKTQAKQINWRQEQEQKPGKRSIDGLYGKCGKFSAPNRWEKRNDAFCDKDAKYQDEEVEIAGVGEFPSHVQLETFDSEKKTICSGVLIHNDAILTANVCIGKEAKALRATAGLIQGGNRDGTQQSYAWGYCRLFNKQKYEHYEDNNVVMVLLRKPFTFNERVQPACVEPRRARNDKVNCYVTGMGKENDSNRTSVQVAAFVQCSAASATNWDLNSGHCFERKTLNQRLDKNIRLQGSGLYCLDKCDGTPKVFTVGIVARGLTIQDTPSRIIETIHVSKTQQFQAPTIGMLSNCFEFVKNEVR